MAETAAKPIFSITSAQQLRVDIDGEPHTIRSMREFRLKDQVAFQRDFQSVAQGWGDLFKTDAAPTDADIEYVSTAIDNMIKRVVVGNAKPFLALTEMQKLEVLGAFAGNAAGGSGAPPKSSSQDSPVSTESTRSA